MDSTVCVCCIILMLNGLIDRSSGLQRLRLFPSLLITIRENSKWQNSSVPRLSFITAVRVDTEATLKARKTLMGLDQTDQHKRFYSTAQII